MPSVLWRCWLGGRKGIRPVKNWVVRCWCGYLSGARCRLAHAELMPLPLTISCSNKIQIGFTFLVLAHPGSPGQRAVKRVCVFSKNDRLFEVRRPTGSHVHRKVVVSKKWREIDTLLLHAANRKNRRPMAYPFVPFPVTLDDLESHSRDAGLIKCNTIRRTFVRHLARFSPTRRVARSLGDSWVSCEFRSQCQGRRKGRVLCI